MAFGRKKKDVAGDLSRQSDLGAEFFGSGAASAPGQKESESDEGTSLLGAVVGASSGAGNGAKQKDDAPSMFSNGGPVDFGPDYTRRSWFQLGGGDNPEVNPYAAEQDKRYGMDPRTRKVLLLFLLCVVAFAVVVLFPSPTYNTEFSYSFAGIVTTLQTNVQGIFEYFDGNQVPDGLVNYKFVTYLIVFFAGIALSVTGAIYQGTLKNALAAPDTLGVNAGAMVGAALFVVFAPTEILQPVSGSNLGFIDTTKLIDYYNSLDLGQYLIVTNGKAFAAILGSFVAVGLVLLVSHLVGRGSSSGFSLIVCGLVITSVASSIVEVVRYYVIETDSTGIRSSVISSAQNGDIPQINSLFDLAFVAIPIIIVVVVITTLSNKLNLLAFKDEEARSMGIRTEGLRWLIVLLCTLITAVVVAFCGNVAFVGFAVPLIARRYVGPNLRHLIPASAFLGALLLVVTRWFADFGFLEMFGLDGSANMVTSVIGLIVFVWITLKQREANRNGDWL